MNTKQIRINEIKRHLRMITKRGIAKIAREIGTTPIAVMQTASLMRVELKQLGAR